MTIGNAAFSRCSLLTSVSIGNSVTTIEGAAFSRCSLLTSVSIGNSVTTIGAGAFSRCEMLTSIIIPNSVIMIENTAFYLCEKLTSVIIGNSVTTIGNNAFMYCSRLTSVIIGNSVTTIGSYAFSGCSRLTFIIIPDSVTTIGDAAFKGCYSLISVSIPNSVTTMGDYAFHLCGGLTFIICEAGTPPVIGEHTFEDVPDTIPVYIPCYAMNAYKTTNYWDVFPNFRGIPDTTFISDTVCHGITYTGNGFTVEDGAGIYYRMDTTMKNCDSVICLTLSEYGVVPLTQYSATICQGDIYSDDNFTNLTQAGDYYDTLQNSNGCDSIVCLHLSVNAIHHTNYSADICQGKAYSDSHFTNLTQAGDYYDTLQNANGCDSIIELTLTINPIYFVLDTVMINQGETYNFFGKLLTQQGIYYDTLQTVYGCDSIFELNLTYKTSIVETEQLDKLNIYPNPTSGQLRVTSDNYELQITNYEIYDILGKKRQSPFEGGRGMSLIDISHLPAGIYFIKIQTGKGIVMKKIIKE